MILTKFEHACFSVEIDGHHLIVDPGGFTTDLAIPDSVIGIVITHDHPDHFDKDMLAAIIDVNPDAIVYAHETITSQLSNVATQSIIVGEGVSVGPFTLEFYGGAHAVIHPDIPVIANVGVMINDTLYYPGDSFTQPDRSVAVLALPVAAPWLKISETMEFLKAVQPQLAFPTHDAILSDTGKALPDRMLPPIAEKIGTTYQRLNEPIEI